MRELSTLFADFNNTDLKGRVRLNTVGTRSDLERKHITLEAGMEVLLDDQDEFKIIGTVEFSEDEKIWVAKINWDELKQ